MTRQNKILILALRHALQHGQEDHITAVSDEILARRGELSRNTREIIKRDIRDGVEQSNVLVDPWVDILGM